MIQIGNFELRKDGENSWILTRREPSTKVFRGIKCRESAHTNYWGDLSHAARHIAEFEMGRLIEEEEVTGLKELVEAVNRLRAELHVAMETLSAAEAKTSKEGGTPTNLKIPLGKKAPEPEEEETRPRRRRREPEPGTEPETPRPRRRNRG